MAVGVWVQAAPFSGGVHLARPRLWIGAALFSVTAAVGLYLSRGGWRSALR